MIADEGVLKPFHKEHGLVFPFFQWLLERERELVLCAYANCIVFIQLFPLFQAML